MTFISTIDIKCPSCANKATFFCESGQTGKFQKVTTGEVRCGHCGYINASFNFTNEHYYYQVSIGNRKVFASSLNHLIGIRNYFYERKKINDEPDYDFPKSFYQQRNEIVKKIDKIMLEEQKHG